jgi:hypothetical protein
MVYLNYGNRAGAISLFHYFKSKLLNVSDLPAGVYFATVIAKRKKVCSREGGG